MTTDLTFRFDPRLVADEDAAIHAWLTSAGLVPANVPVDARVVFHSDDTMTVDVFLLNADGSKYVVGDVVARGTATLPLVRAGHLVSLIPVRTEAEEREQAAYERGVAEGRRQATEGFIAECQAAATDHRSRYRPGPPPSPPGTVDDRPRDLRSLHVAIGLEQARDLARRRLLADGPWEPAEQATPHWTFCSYCYTARQHNSRHCRSDGACCEPSQPVAEQATPSCTCPLIDVTIGGHAASFVKGYDASCPVCPSPYAKAEQDGVDR